MTFETTINNSNSLARFFDKVRETVESAETPFARLAVFLLPIASPSVPATLTAMHMYKLFIQIFTFNHADIFSGVLSVIVGLVLEALGYVGAILFTNSLFKLVREDKNKYMLPTFLNGFAYGFYLLLMFLVNYQLGLYFQTPQIMNNIVGLLSFITVPTSLLMANHLSEKQQQEDDYKSMNFKVQTENERLALEHQFKMAELEQGNRARQDTLKIEAEMALEKERLKLKKKELQLQYQETVKQEQQLTSSPQTKTSYSRDWRKYSETLSYEDLFDLAHADRPRLKWWADKIGMTEKSAENWRFNAQLKLLSIFISTNHRFPSTDELITLDIPSTSVAKFIVKNADKLVGQGYIDQQIVENAKQKVSKQ